MDPSLQTLTDVLDRADRRLLHGSHAAPRVWPTGFDALDLQLAGGLRSGELTLLAGAQGIGKTTWALQVARSVARSGRSALLFSFEHDAQSLLVRLVALEAGELGGFEAPSVTRIRSAFEDADGRTGPVADRLSGSDSGAKAVLAVREYASRLTVHQSLGSRTSVEVVRAAVDEVRRATGQLPLLVVDYLQKLHVPGDRPEEERIALGVQGLKDLALEVDVPVLAIAAADKAGLAAGRRVRVSNLRGPSVVAYEADTVLILNDKYDVVARHHLMYGGGDADRFKPWVVLSIEKNRSGRGGVDLEFRKRLDQSRFEPDGRLVAEQLVDERVHLE